MQAEKLLTPGEVAARVGVSRDTVYRWIGNEDLAAVDLSAGEQRARWRISESELRRFLDSRAIGRTEL